MRSQTEETYRQRILRVLVHIQGHLDEALSLDELAQVAHFSPYHFHRIFRGMVGESVKEHVRRLRLERAAHRLKCTDERVTRIAFDAGYETHESFTRAFGAMFGESPSRFREIHRALPFAEVPSGVHFRADGRLDDFQPVKSTGAVMDVRIELVPATRVAFIRHVGPYNEVGPTWGRLMAWLLKPSSLHTVRKTRLPSVPEQGDARLCGPISAANSSSEQRGGAGRPANRLSTSGPSGSMTSSAPGPSAGGRWASIQSRSSSSVITPSSPAMRK